MIQPKRADAATKCLLASVTACLLSLFGCAEGTLPLMPECLDGSSRCASAASRGGAGGAAGGSGGATVSLGGSVAGMKASGGADAGGAGLPTTGGTGSSGSGSGGSGFGGDAIGGVGGSPMGGMAGGLGGGGGGGPMPTDVAMDKPATADSEEGDNTAERGNDQNTGTRWCAADGALEHYWQVDLGRPYTLVELEITFEFEGRQYGYVVEGSSDDDGYETLLDRTSNAKQTQVQTEPLSGSARYVRIRFVALPENTWASFHEAKVRGA